ncbi:MAG TPA: cupin domain-containing protein [Gaiellales bacterium]|nr:cupin domain-containing protein [Gaiellales bacterium]
MNGDEPFAAALAGGLIASPDAAIVVAEWADPGGGDPPRYIAPLHVHHEDDEAWYVLEGALVVRSDDRDVHLPAGGAAIVPRGVAHTYWNPEPGPTRYLLVMTPRIRALIDALHALDERTADAVAAVFSTHRSEYLGWP